MIASIVWSDPVTSPVAFQTTSKVPALFSEEYHLVQSYQSLSLLNPTEATEPAVQMESFNVTESMARRDLEQKISENRARELSEEFRWDRGGLIGSKTVGRAQIDLGIWPKLLFPQVMARRNHSAVLLNVDILKLNW
ncbi:MAG TPA: hypothetical protein VKC60_07205 [Opitutaceae bacterium]|nr:hypothetical protein [Opitutaceae bacterium]